MNALEENALLNLGRQPGAVVFEVQSDTELPLPAGENTADWVTFFSVFPGWPDQRIYRYLEESKRVLKADGKIVFSFLDYEVPAHWEQFLASVGQEALLAGEGADRQELRFINRPMIEAWALHLGMTLEYHYSGDVKWLQPLSGAPEVEYSDAQLFGESVAVLALA